ncbi:MAG: sigma-54-dependent Fis family transcriptional regulator [Alphaproteobacteria bacterium]|nr:MAG: sigma-54-dependent Fis family transcriptional regulator [Alphaproteobacteria bacterium]
MPAILIVDDDAAMRDALAEAVRDLGYDARMAISGEAALDMLHRERVSAVLLDLRMPGMGGLEVLRRIRTRSHPPPVTVLTAHATATNTIEAMRLGAFDHLTKPIGREGLARALEGMLAGAGEPRVVMPDAELETLIGSSEAMRTVQKKIGMLADSDATVLITGETGTGKELVSRAIHDHGHHSGGPFIAVNCASIPVELMESELFGHARGAFTGAISDRAGAFRQAQHGTLFLDEIGDMDVAVQAKILRALQERIVTPVGGKPFLVDVRVIAATHRDLTQRVRDGTFREDLFYRLHVVPIHLPPLRERIADIVPLAEHFLSRAACGKRLSADAAARLIRHAWPGNVRELKNTMERAAILVRGEFISAADLAFLEVSNASQGEIVDWPDEDLPTAVARLEEMLIRRALERSAGNRTEAARMLNIHRQLLYAKIRRFGLDVSEARTEGIREAGEANQ